MAPDGAGAPFASTVLQATGYVTARRQATVSTQITGTLTQVLIEVGDRVQGRQVIARLDDRGLRAALELTQAQLSAQMAQLIQVRAQLAQAEADARRQEDLMASGMTTRQAAEQARTVVASARALVELRHREIDAARAQLAQAQINFDHAVVRAPFTGVVTAKTAQVGEIVSPLSAGGGFTRTGVCTIVDMDSLEVDVEVSESFIAQVKPGMPAQATLDAYPDWHVPAHVVSIVPSADRGKATVRVRVGLEVKDRRILPDLGVRVSFLGTRPATAGATAPAARGVLVPAQALAQRDGRNVVFVVVDGKAAQREVMPSPQEMGMLKLLPDVGSAIRAGDKVVLSPPAQLHDGAAVRTAD